jgi:TPR repeat protein
MVNLAILYERGSGVERSLVDAYAWYSSGGEAGDATAKQRAAEIYRQLSDLEKARGDGLAATIAATIRASVPAA